MNERTAPPAATPPDPPAPPPPSGVSGRDREFLPAARNSRDAAPAPADRHDLDYQRLRARRGTFRFGFSLDFPRVPDLPAMFKAEPLRHRGRKPSFDHAARDHPEPARSAEVLLMAGDVEGANAALREAFAFVEQSAERVMGSFEI
jgi:hypothetical protein